MKLGSVYLFSPFSPSLAAEEQNRTVLLQFLLHELLNIHEAISCNAPSDEILSQEPLFFPYDWARHTGHLNKAWEHSSLLTIAFPGSEKKVKAIQQILKRNTFDKETIQEVYLLIEGLAELCKEDENLIFFLLKQQKKIAILMGPSHLRTFLEKISVSGLRGLEKKLCDAYHERGFFSLIPELKELMLELENDNL